MGRLKLFFPLLVFVALAVLFTVVLRDEDYDPQALPSALINKPMPSFQLPALLDEQRQLNEKDLIGKVALVNVWATWCISCRVEHPYLIRLTEEEKLPIYGINYKDDSQEAQKWLKTLGNPYRFNVVDADGRLGLDLGVYGAPETYVLDKKGIIRYKHVGVINESVWQSHLKAVVTQLRGEDG